ncbi:short chain dehydrogenase [compost metagenome]
MRIYGIEVVLIEPGPIRTPIWSKAQPDPRYLGTDYSDAMQALQGLVAHSAATGAPVGKVSQTVLEAVRVARPKARYPLNSMWYLVALLPRALLDRILAQKLSLRRRQE